MLDLLIGLLDFLQKSLRYRLKSSDFTLVILLLWGCYAVVPLGHRWHGGH